MSSLILLLILSTLLPSTTPKTSPPEIQILQSIKSSISPSSIPPGSCLSSWNFSVDPCDSISTPYFTCGIRCTTTTTNLSHITAIALDPAGYSGPLHPSIFSLPFLESLDLSDNMFSASFPSLSPDAALLRRITVSQNRFSGYLPDLSSSPLLEEAFFDNNMFSSYSHITSSTILTRLEIQHNNITGYFPNISGLTNLNYFDASDNLFTGEFPDNLPASLLEVSVRNNRLTGSLSRSSVANLENLQVLDLSRNGISGAVTRAVFEHPVLEQVTLSYNRFEWIESPGDGGMDSELVALDLSHNELAGLLPGFVGLMPRLSALDLGENRFTGMIPVQYAMRVVGGEGMVGFGRMVLKGNYLFGPVPEAMGSLKERNGEVSLKDNCLFRCPVVFFFCEDGMQKSSEICREFNPVIP